MSTRHTGKLAKRPSDRVTDLQYFERYKARCTVTAAGCWVMRGCQTQSKGMHKGSPGYVQISYRGARWMAHRIMFTIAHGPIPNGNVVAHNCDNPPCCNPAHLFTCTESENIQDASAKKRHYNGKQTHCRHGHEFTPQNTYLSPAVDKERPGMFRRRCKACVDAGHRTPSYIAWARAYQKQRRARIRAERNITDEEQSHAAK